MTHAVTHATTHTMTHIVVLFSNLGPYHLARLNRLHTACQQRGWRMTALELARTEADYAWKTSLSGSPFLVISLSANPLEHTSFSRMVQRLWATLTQLQPDAVAIAGYGRPTMLAALGWSLWHHLPAVLMSETTAQDAPRQRWRETLKCGLISGYDAALVGGQPQKQYLAELGFLPAAIFTGYNSVGNATFDPNQIASLPRPVARPYFLAVNRFIAKKNLPFLLSAYATYRAAAGAVAWDLVLCGDGELRPQLTRQIADLALTDSVHLPGFLQQAELLPYLAHAECFVHASLHEQWGLVVNEAMAAGLPVLVSNRCGCYTDLVVEGVTGLGFDPTEQSTLVALLHQATTGVLPLHQMGRAAFQHIQQFSPDGFAQGCLQAVEYAIAHSRWGDRTVKEAAKETLNGTLKGTLKSSDRPPSHPHNLP